MELLSFTITLENCDRIEINPRHVLYSSFKDIRPELSSVHNSRYVFEQEVCHDAAFLLSREANVRHLQFGMPDWNEKSVFGRLTSYADITHIEVAYVKVGGDNISEDQKTRRFTIPWSDGDYHENKFQKAEVNEHGDLIVEIRSEARVDDNV